MSRRPETTVVIGGGISGVAAAWLLAERGCPPVILERSEQLGGRVAPGWLGTDRVDYGGKNIGHRYREFRELAAAVGLTDFVPFGVNTARADDDRLARYDSSRRGRWLLENVREWGLRDLSRLLAMGVHIRLRAGAKFIGDPYFVHIARRGDHRPLSSHFRPATVDGLLRPLTVRMNGAEPGEAWIGNLGTNLGVLLDSHDQLAGGMARLFERVADRCTVRLSTAARQLVWRHGRICGVLAECQGVTEEIPATHVLIATPARGAAPLVDPIQSRLASRLAEIAYHPVTVLLARYQQPLFPEDMRACIFGAEHPLSNAGAYGKEARDVVRYTFSGARSRDHLPAVLEMCHGNQDKAFAHLLDEAEALLSAHTRLDVPAREVWGGRTFDPGLCAYGPDHHHRIAEIRALASRAPGLELAGDYLCGASIEACVRSGRRAAERILAASAQTGDQGRGSGALAEAVAGLPRRGSGARAVSA